MEPTHSSVLSFDTVLGPMLLQAARTPDAIALTAGGSHISYRQQWARASRWACHLRSAGAGADPIVALNLRRTEDLLTAILAVLRAGGAYLPLDPAFPPARCAQIVRASGARLLVTDAAHAGEELPAITPAALDRPLRAVDLPMPAGRQLAYVIYTSGSTGTPKGVAIEHSALLNHMAWMLERFGAAAGRVLQRTSCAFDASVWELLLPLMAGGTLVAMDGEDARNPAAVRRVCVRETPSAAQCVPTFLRFALENRALEGTALRYLFVGGEPLRTELAEAAARSSGATVVNLYGPTETTIDATYFEVTPSAVSALTVPIGEPIANTWAHRMDSAGEPAPGAAPGELWIGGVGLARGYHRDPRATAQAFVPDPVSPAAGGRTYRTGDIVRALASGSLTFVARVDRQVKVGGYRVELAEIENVLRRHPQVRDATVQVIEGSEGRTLVAYCLRVHGNGDSDALRTFMLAQLPRYMVPARTVWLDEFPVNASGKLETNALPRATPQRHAAGECPASETEHTLASIWSGLFKREISVEDNFFEAGGDSIRAIQVVAAAKERGLDLKLQDVFEAPTVRGLADRVRRTPPAAPRCPLDLVPQADRARLDAAAIEDAYPTTVLLDTLRVLSDTSPRYELYVTSCELPTRWEPEAFRIALERAVERHAWLRTSFAYHDYSRPLQIVHRSVPVRWTVEDLSALDRLAQDRHIAEWAEREKHNRFDWSVAPLWRCTVHLRGADRFQLTLSEPMFDGWSVSTLLGELLSDYAAASRGSSPAARPPLRARYRDFVAAEQESIGDPRCQQFWSRRAGEDVGRKLPRWSPRGLRNEGVLRVEMRVTDDVSDRLRALARSIPAPLKSVLLAAHVRVLAAALGHAKLATGVIVNGRAETADAAGVLGLHLNTVPLVFDVGGSTTWLDLIRHAFETEREALPYRRYPLSAIQKRHGRAPLFDTVFNFTHFHGLAASLDAAGLEITNYLAWDQTFFPLTAQFHVDVSSSTIGLGLDYDSSELAQGQVEEMAGLYRLALERIAADAGAPCKAALRATPAQASPRRTSQFAVDRVDVLESVGRMVHRHPDSVALSCAGRHVTYATLARAVCALADDLDSHDVAGRNVLVCSDTQFEAAVALLAIFHAGGIYVPLDPAAPAMRLEGIARSASASLCLCSTGSVRQAGDAGLAALVIDGAALARRGAAPRAWGPTPPTAGYRMHTSGSTGTPKGIDVGHEALMPLLLAMQRDIGFSRQDVVGGLATIAFDPSLVDILLPLTTGARLVAISRDVCRNGERLGRALSALDVTWCQATPTTWRLLVESGSPLPRGLTALTGGEALSRPLVRELLARGASVTNIYGPTEATVWAAAAAIPDADGITLGTALGGTGLSITDAFGEESLPGVPGDIWVRGDGVRHVHGYAGAPSLTAARFTPDPTGGGRRIYRTGDRAVRTTDGIVQFLGRLDDQVKIRGHRIELGEVEHALRACPGVRGAAVKVHGEDTPALVGYVLLERGAAWDDGLAKRELRRILPEHMVPRHLVVLDAFPLTLSQKVDRSRLPAPAPPAPAAPRLDELIEHVKAMSPDTVRRALIEHR